MRFGEMRGMLTSLGTGMVEVWADRESAMGRLRSVSPL
jgi:hypothetical protein